MNHHGWKYSTLPALRQVPAVRLYAERTPVSCQAMNGQSPAEAADTSPRTTTDATWRGGNGSRRSERGAAPADQEVHQDHGRERQHDRAGQRQARPRPGGQQVAPLHQQQQGRREQQQRNASV